MTQWHKFATEYTGNKIIRYYERIGEVKDDMAVVIEYGKSIQEKGKSEGSVEITHSKTENLRFRHDMVRPFTSYDRSRCRHEEGRSFYQFGKSPIFVDPRPTAHHILNGLFDIIGEYDDED